jgi:hypothetical protein
LKGENYLFNQVEKVQTCLFVLSPSYLDLNPP